MDAEMVYYSVVGIALLALLLFFRKRAKPRPPTDLFLRRTGMGSVTATWVKSVSTNVTEQHLAYRVDDGDMVEVVLDKDVETHVISDLPSNSRLHVEVWAATPFKVSLPVSADLDIPDLDVPAPPTNLTLSLS